MQYINQTAREHTCWHVAPKLSIEPICLLTLGVAAMDLKKIYNLVSLQIILMINQVRD